jgi:hypothetical protein
LWLSAAVAARAAAAVAAAGAVATTASSASARPGNGNAYGNGGGNGHHCFLKGTLIRTPSGDMPIEQLAIGDMIDTVCGKPLPIKWIGRRNFAKSGPSWPKAFLPIRIARSAFADDVPSRDLYLSANHALFIDGCLVPARDLINDTTISAIPADHLGRLEYFQILLESHQAIYAEGATAESFIAKTLDELELFSNFAEYKRLYGDRFEPMQPFARNLGSRSQHLRGLMLSALPSAFGVRDPLHDIYARIGARGAEMHQA